MSLFIKQHRIVHLELFCFLVYLIESIFLFNKKHRSQYFSKRKLTNIFSILDC